MKNVHAGLLFLLLLASANLAKAQDILNGQFEYPCAPGIGRFAFPSQMVGFGWIYGSNSTLWKGPYSSIVPQTLSGEQYVQLGSVSQSVNGFVPGHTYEVKFYYTGPDPVSMSINGAQIYTTQANPFSGWAEATSSAFVASEASNTVAFSAFGNGFITNIQLVDLDNPVSVAAVTLSSPSVVTSSAVSGTVTLNKPAPKDILVTLDSTDCQAATVPQTVLVKAGAILAAFTVNTSLSPDALQIFATYNGSVSANLAVFSSPSPGCVSNGGFEQPPFLGEGSWCYDAQLPYWFMGGNAGLGNGSNSWQTPNSGNQFAFLLESASIQQPITGLNTGHHYKLESLVTQRRGVSLSDNEVQMTFNGISIMAPYLISGSNYSVAASSAFVPTTATGTFLIEGVTFGGETDVAIDDVSLVDLDNPVSIASLRTSGPTLDSGASLTGTVTLNLPAPAGGATVRLEIGDWTSAEVPPFVIVQAGQTAASFPITGSYFNVASTSLNIRAIYNGWAEANITTQAGNGLGFAFMSSAVEGGDSLEGVLSIQPTAITGPTTVTLQSSSWAVVVPASITLKPNANVVFFSATALPVNSDSHTTVTATIGSTSIKLSLTILSARPLSLYFSNNLTEPGTLTGTVKLASPAGPAGVKVALTSSSAAATVPSSVAVLPGNLTATFSIAAGSVTQLSQANIIATSNGASIMSTLDIVPSVALSSVAVVPQSNSNGLDGTVTLAGNTPVSEIVSLSSSDPTNAPVQSTVTVPVGAASETFYIRPLGVLKSETVTITATYKGVSKTALATLLPPAIYAVQIFPLPTNSNIVSGQIMLTSPAPFSGIVVSLKSSDPVNAYVPSSVTATQSVYGFFNLIFQPVAVQESVTITATLGAATKTTTITLVPPSLSGINLLFGAVQGAEQVGGVVYLTGVAPKGGIAVALTSTDPTNASVPTSIVVPYGSSLATFTITCKAVSVSEYVTITAALGGIKAPAVIQLQ